MRNSLLHRSLGRNGKGRWALLHGPDIRLRTDKLPGPYFTVNDTEAMWSSQAN
jgi:hypothetical protein